MVQATGSGKSRATRGLNARGAMAALAFAACAAIASCRGSPSARTDLPPPSDAPYKNAALPVQKRVEDLLSRMSLEEKAGQMAQVARDYVISPSDIGKYGFGSMLSGGGSAPPSNAPSEWLKMVNGYQGEALKSRLAIPLLYGVDAVHGHNNVAGATIFPQHAGLGATGDPALVEAIGRVTADEVAATGIHWNFSPCIAVSRDERWGRAYESYSEDPALVAKLGAAEIRGLQGAGPGAVGAVLATAKHYFGDGGTEGGRDRGDVLLKEADFRAIHLTPYIDAVAAGAETVMVSFSSYQGAKMHGNGDLVTRVLRGELGFKGLTVSDWAAQKELPGGPSDQIRETVNAGVDMVMIPDSYQAFVPALAALAKSGAVKKARIDEAVGRILSLKFKLGLFEKPYGDGAGLDRVGSVQHRALAREAVRKSMVLLKNEGVLPLARNAGRIAVVGQKAANAGYQCGGWTLTWQGVAGKVPGATTILKGIIDGVSGAEVVYSPDGTDIAGCQAAVVVVGEAPYAEMKGDRADLSLDAGDKALIRAVKASGVPMTIVLLSGRPMIVTAELALADAFVAAWLPGSEGEGVADVLLGAYAPTGKLPFTWPASIADVPINAGDGKKPLFPLGYGLSY
jgi:beta-glucosidase